MFDIYASMSDLETAISKSDNSALQDKIDGTPVNNGRCNHSRIRASVPWQASLSVLCRIGHVPARVNDLLDVINYLREVCGDRFVIFHVLYFFAKVVFSMD